VGMGGDDADAAARHGGVVVVTSERKRALAPGVRPRIADASADLPPPRNPAPARR